MVLASVSRVAVSSLCGAVGQSSPVLISRAFVAYVAQARERVEDVFRLHCISAVSDFHVLSPLKVSADGRR